MKPSSSIIKPDDPTEVGRKRAPSDRKDDESIANRPLKRQELVPVPRKRSPTYLQLSFLVKSTQPRIAELKAKIVRFGQIDVPKIRVYWKSFSCVVLFVCKEDAEAACKYCRSNDLFRGVKMSYHLKENDP